MVRILVIVGVIVVGLFSLLAITGQAEQDQIWSAAPVLTVRPTGTTLFSTEDLQRVAVPGSVMTAPKLPITVNPGMQVKAFGLDGPDKVGVWVINGTLFFEGRVELTQKLGWFRRSDFHLITPDVGCRRTGGSPKWACIPD